MAIIDKPSDYFNTKLYVGNESTNAITGVGHQPDFVWMKNRASAYYHGLYDSVRGTGNTKSLYSNANETEGQNSGNMNLASFNSDGFTLGATSSTNIINKSSQNHVSWNWKAGTTAIPSGSTTDPLGVSINTTSGFGIYKITSPASGSYVLKHGLGKKPKMVIVKDLEAVQKWMVWSDTFSNATNDYIKLNSTDAKLSYSTCWGTMNSTDCTISVGGTLDANNDHVVYIFTDVNSYCKHGSYTGNGNANGPFVYTGFKPAWVLQKNVSATQGWQLQDNKRNGFNGANKLLQPNDSAAESDVNRIDILSNGFKVITTDAGQNTSGASYIYMAFAENPFVASNFVPATAR